MRIMTNIKKTNEDYDQHKKKRMRIMTNIKKTNEDYDQHQGNK